MTAVDFDRALDVALAELRLSPDTLEHRVLEDGRILAARVLLFGFQVTISTPSDLIAGVITDAWEYAASGPLGHGTARALMHAAHAVEHWDGNGEPTGWTRHNATGRRRPEGDPEREYVRR